MKKYYLFFCFFGMLISCKYGIWNKDMPNNSKWLVEADGWREENGTIYTYNLDEATSGTVRLTAKHYKDSSEKNYNFSFSSPNLNIIQGLPGKSVVIDLTAIKSPGSYVVKAKSSVASKYDLEFVISAKTNIKEVSYTYSMRDIYRNNNLAYEDGELEGEVNKFTTKLTLISGVVYDFIPKETKITPKGKSDNIQVATWNIGEQGNASLSCVGLGDTTSNVSLSLGDTNIGVSFALTLRDNSSITIEEIKKDTSANEKIINLNANEVKSFSFTPIMSGTNKNLVWSLDAYNFNETAWRNDPENYEAPINPNSTWYSMNTLSCVENGTLMFDVKVDDQTNRATITSYADTSYNIPEGNFNYHKYLAVKYSGDTKIKDKYRIMVGGVLEGINITSKDSSDKETPVNLITVGKDSVGSWKLVGRFIPESIKSTNGIIWYITTDPKMTTQLQNGNKIPTPSKIQPLSMRGWCDMSWKDYCSSTSKTNPLIDLSGKFLDIPIWYIPPMESYNNTSEIWLNYEYIGRDFAIVALDLDSFKYSYVSFDDQNDNEITVKAIGETRCVNPDDCEIWKGADGIAEQLQAKALVQEYPTTQDPAYPSCRTFWIDVDSICSLQIDSSFNLDSITASLSLDGKNYLLSPQVELDKQYLTAGKTFSRKATISCETLFHSFDPSVKMGIISDTTGDCKNLFIDDYIFKNPNGIICTLDINEQYKIKLRFCMFNGKHKGAKRRI